MKKAVITLVIVIAMLSVFYGVYILGHNQPLDVKDSSVVLLKPTKQWTDVYGDGYDSQVHFTIALLINVVNRQGEVIGKLTRDVNDLKFDMVLGK